MGRLRGVARLRAASRMRPEHISTRWLISKRFARRPATRRLDVAGWPPWWILPGMAAARESSDVRRPGRPRTPVPREVLVGAAVGVFADYGYGAASLDRIAEESGIRKSSLLHRFGTKEALYVEALTTVLGALGAMVSGAATGEEGFAGRLDRLSALITDYFFAEPRAARLLFREVMDRGPLFSGERGRRGGGVRHGGRRGHGDERGGDPPDLLRAPHA